MGFPPARILRLLLPALLAAGCASAAEGRDLRALPILERERPVTGAPRITDWFWPFGHVEEGVASRSSGFRPLWREVDSDAMRRQELLYPLWRSTESKGAISTRLMPIYWHDLQPTQWGPDSDTTVLPILFWGCEYSAPEVEGGAPVPHPYFLLFPVGGTVHQKFLADETTFVLFPLYAGTRTGEWRGRHFLWPIIHWGSDGDRRHGWRVWPFYGESVKEGIYDRHSVLWPIVHWGTEGMDRDHPVHGWLVWPLLGREYADDGHEAWTVLWPFFSWSDGPTMRERSLPYPIYRTRTRWEMREGERVETENLFWLWPFYGRFDRWGEESSRFYAWPLVWWSLVSDGNVDEESFAVAPIWRSVERTPKKGGPGDSWWKLWPLAEGETLRDGSGGWTALSPIPWFRWPEFEANWGVFFELARVRRGPDGSRSTDLLFSLIRDRTGPGGTSHRIPLLWNAENGKEGTSWNLLEGLIGGETKPGGASSLRLLWFLRIPAGGGESE